MRFNHFFPRLVAARLSSRDNRVSWSRPVVRIATAGVVIGIALIVIATSIVHGFQSEVKELVVGFGADIQVLNGDPEDQKIIRNPRLEAELRSMEDVQGVHPMYTLPGILESKTDLKGVVAKGFNAETAQTFLRRFLTTGEVPSESDASMVISLEMSRKLQVGVGDRVTLYLVGGPSGIRPRTLTVKGIYRTGLLEYDEEFVLIPASLIQQTAGWGLEIQALVDSNRVETRVFGSSRDARLIWQQWTETGWETLGWGSASTHDFSEVQGDSVRVIARLSSDLDVLPDTAWFERDDQSWKVRPSSTGWAQAASGLEIFIDQGAELGDVEQRVFNALPIGYYTETVYDQAPEMFAWLGMLDLNVEIIIGMMVLIAIINMTSALLILILERRPMVGMLKSLGMQDGDVMLIFFWQAVRILGRGFLAGNMLGLGLVFLQLYTGWVKLDAQAYYLDEVPVRINLIFLVGVEGCAFALCALMTWVPALASLRIQPAEALRMNR